MPVVKHPHILLNLAQKSHQVLMAQNLEIKLLVTSQIQLVISQVHQSSHPKVQLILGKEQKVKMGTKHITVCFAKVIIQQTIVESTRHPKLDGLLFQNQVYLVKYVLTQPVLANPVR